MNLENQPLVSVLMTVYNREKYIAQAIESVLASTYKNWELIVVDDCSKDGSVAIAIGYADKDERINIYLNETNLGDYPNRNQAASYAKGKYIKYVDADDIIYPYGLEQLVFYMEQFPKAGYGLLSLKREKERFLPYLLSPNEAYLTHYTSNPIFNRAPLSSIIKRELFIHVGGFTGKRMLGDFEMWHILSKKFNVLLMPIGMVAYRTHEDQESSEIRNNPFVAFKYTLLSKSFLDDKDIPLKKEDRENILKIIKKKESKEIISAFYRHSFKKGMELYKYSNQNVMEVLYNLLNR
ncbi:MAG: glycosyltransferase family 2 protein [Gelidibacter sp.]